VRGLTQVRKNEKEIQLHWILEKKLWRRLELLRMLLEEKTLGSFLEDDRYKRFYAGAIPFWFED